MTTSSGLRPITALLAALVAIPLVMMGIVMPLMAIAKGGMGGGMMGSGTMGGLQMLLPLLPLTLLALLGYVLYRTASGRGRRQNSKTSLDELRAAYARGDLSDEEFETRHDRLQGRSTESDGASDD